MAILSGSILKSLNEIDTGRRTFSSARRFFLRVLPATFAFSKDI